MFIKSNNEITYTASDIEAMEEIPGGNWLLKFCQIKGYYLESTPNFKLPKKIYGDAEKLAKRYLNTFNKVDGNLGVLLTGTKGTGKSVTAKLTAHNSNLAVIIITEPFHDDNFKSFLSNITQKCVVFVDEFEKVYHTHELQNNFLSILDGVFEGKKLFLFTSNEKDKVNNYMLNRPGRIHYLGEYDSLSADIVDDVIDDNLVKKKNKEGLMKVLNILGTITMDILISLIREMNMYNETAKESIVHLNLRPESNLYNVEIYQNDNRLGSTSIYDHPLGDETMSIEFMCDDINKYIKPVDLFTQDNKVSVANDVLNPDFELTSLSASREWLYLEINITESKVINKDKKIIVESDNGMKYIFSKKREYSYAF